MRSRPAPPATVLPSPLVLARTLAHACSRRRLAALFAFVATLLAAVPGHAIEEPRYTLVRADGAFEVRDYAPQLLAETRVKADFEDAGNAAFRRLFDYIGGANTPARTLAMTAPVTQRADRGADAGTDIAMTAPVNQVADGDSWRVAFVVPSQYDRRTVPQPEDPRVAIVEVPARRMGVWRFSGRWTQAAFDAAEADLRRAIARSGLVAVGPAVIARYNSPFSLPFLRRNEVLIEVREAASQPAGGRE
jgi:hypothetical protein